MSKHLRTMLFVLLSMSLSHMVYANSYQNALNNFNKSPQIRSFFNSAYGYAIFPTVGKGGFGLGGAHGKGRVYRRGALVGKASLNQITVGFQFGGQAFSQIVFFEDERSLKDFTSGSFEFGAQATAVAITIGAQAHAGTTGTSSGASLEVDDPGLQTAKYYKGMATFIHVKGGLMYEASVGGQKFLYTPLGADKARALSRPQRRPVYRTTTPTADNTVRGQQPATVSESGATTYAVDPIEPVRELD